MRLNNPNQRRRGCEKVKDTQNWRVSSSKKRWKNHTMIPPLDDKKGEIEIARMVIMSRGTFFANLTLFDWHFARQKVSLIKIAILKIQSHLSWGDAFFSLGVAEHPTTIRHLLDTFQDKVDEAPLNLYPTAILSSNTRMRNKFA